MGRQGGAAITYGTIEDVRLNTGAFVDNVYVRSTGGQVTATTVSTAGGNDIVSVYSTSNAASLTTINTGIGDDEVRIGLTGFAAPGYPLDNIQGPVSVDGGGGTNDNLYIDDGDHSTNRTYTVTSTTIDRSGAARITYAGIEDLGLKAGLGDDNIFIQSTNSSTVTFISGNAGNDRFTLASGPPNPNRIDAILGRLRLRGSGVFGQFHTDTLIVNDVAAAAGRTYTLGAGTLGWGATTNLEFWDVQNLTLNAGNQGNTINVLAIDAASNIYPGNGTNEIRVGSTNDATSTLAGIQGALNINSGDGNDTLTLNDQAAAAGQTYVVTAETVSRGGIGTISYAHTSDFGMTNLVLNGGGASTYNVQGTIRHGTTTINAGAGNDIINVGSALGATSTLDGILGNLMINGQGGVNTLTIDDRGSPRGQQYFRSQLFGIFRRGTGPTISHTNTPNVTIREANQPPAGGMSSLGNGIDVFGFLAAIQDLIIASSGDDTLNLNGSFETSSTTTFDGGLGIDRAVVVSNYVATPQIQLLNTENLEVTGDMFAPGDTFSPGGLGAASQFALTGNYTQTANGILELELGTPGSGSDKLTFEGTVSLGGMLTLSTLPGFVGGIFTILDNTGPSAIVGIFEGLAEGAIFSLHDSVTQGGWLTQISYVGGTGNDVVLTILSSNSGQWANGVDFVTSEFNTSPGPFSAWQSTGARNTFVYGDQSTAWSTQLADNGPEHIILRFQTAVYATGVTIWETNNNGFVTEVVLIEPNGTPHSIWTGTDPTPRGTPAQFTITFPAANYLVDRVKVVINTNTVLGQNAFEQIDAVMLHGSAGGGGSGLAAGGGGGSLVAGGPASLIRRTSVSSLRSTSLAPLATLSVIGPIRVGSPVTFRFTNPQATGLRYSFDFNNDGDFTDAGEVSDSTSATATHTFRTRGWHIVHGRVRTLDGLFRDFWIRVFVEG